MGLAIVILVSQNGEHITRATGRYDYGSRRCLSYLARVGHRRHRWARAQKRLGFTPQTTESRSRTFSLLLQETAPTTLRSYYTIGPFWFCTANTQSQDDTIAVYVTLTPPSHVKSRSNETEMEIFRCRRCGNVSSAPWQLHPFPVSH